jgi:hypothetical protein
MAHDIRDIGGNRPPEADDFEALKARADTLADTADKWMAERPEIDEASEQADSDFLVQLRACSKELETARKRDQKPHQERVNAIREQYKPAIALVDDIVDAMKAKVGVWLRKKEAARKAEEERKAKEAIEKQRAALREAAKAEESRKFADRAKAQHAQEEADRAAKALTEKAHEKVRTVSDHGTQAGLIKRVYVEIEDINKLDLIALAHHLDVAAVEKAIRAYVKANKRGDELPTLRGALIEWRDSVASR